ncbi:MAG TPA: hybrid sensor histidine kinase/response regulator [Methanoregula sp.]|nr:hybrid sensor histidine kinase/response regulator [Methanoregula sp.]
MLSILFVDDETPLLKVTKNSLEQTGEFCIDTSVSVTEAIRKLETTRYDAIVSGHRMTDIDSVALVKFIRSRYGRLPFILFADKGTEDVAIEAFNGGADFYLRKQRDAKDQSAELEHMIRQAVMRRQKDEGKPGGFFCDSQDSPGSKTADDQFRWGESYTDQNPDPFMEIDLNKEILTASPASITCLKNLHMPENPAAFLPPDIDAIIQSFTAGRNPVLYREVPVGDALFEESLILSPDGLAIRIYAHDITRWVRIIHALEQANRKRSRLTGITRHDIRNKLTGVLGYLELATESTSDPVLIEYLRRAESSATAIRHQVDFTKDYENLGSNVPTWGEVSAIIADVQKKLDPGAISIKDHAAGISIYADSLFSQVLFDLVDNSLRHGEHVSSIRISGQETADGLVLVYEDDGVGIPEDKKEKIFNRIVDRSSGIGLFLVREVLSITGITIKENGTPGKGARFEMSVPKNGYRMKREQISP